MPWGSRWQFDIPITSLPSYLFQSPTAPLSKQPAYIDAEKPEYHLTFETYRLWSKRLAAGLLKRGFRAGDRVLLYSGNTIFFPVVFAGTLMAGGIFSGANPTYVARELAYQLKDSGALFLITAEANLDTALQAADSISFPHSQVFSFDGGYDTLDGKGKSFRGIAHWSALLASEEEGSRFSWPEVTTREQMQRTAVLNYSSGTTGVPKGVEISHLNYVSNCMQTIFMTKLAPDYEERLVRARALGFLPMYHAYGQTTHCVACPTQGIPVYVVQKFDFVKMLQWVEKYRITILNLVPPIVVAMTKRPEVKKYDISSIEGGTCGAAPLGPEPQLEFERLWPDKQIYLKQGWGMTEITCSACGFDPNMNIFSSAVGELNPNVEGMILRDDGTEADYDKEERGEFLVRAPNVMNGYWRKPEATLETVTPDGWLKTGDIAYKDHLGLIHIVDRKKELIKVKGNQVAPAELEALLLDHPAVQDAAVVGVTIRGEEVPRAYVVLTPDAVQTTRAEDIAGWLSTRVARHKRLAGGVRLVDAIQKNASGKILRRELRAIAKMEVGDSEVRESRL
ncbi:putative 4-coumarate-CoA ligase [Polychaeton citri CBS 116435]|uniref:4-coumarate-CoA ligase n=1 Tax=Polychaeton citri CBS 116435 TaxID=1314669 RepID=A0A9P4QHV5_9PEZI|nr:putative 4-coumarate-CoA ligase [Polychaeton citri CBS 116435]